MLDHLSLVRGIIVRRHGFWHHSPHFLGLNFRPWFKLEVLKVFLICCLGFEFMRLVLRKADHVRWPLRSYFFQHFVMLPQFFLLLFGERLFVRGLSFEWKRIEWVLRGFLVENIILTISPVWESLRVRGVTQNRFILILRNPYLLLYRLCLKVLEISFISGVRFNFMGVDNFRLFF